MNETMLTVRGNLVDDPTLRQTRNGNLVANFRVASTQRRYDRDQAAWVDGDTLYVAVSAWRALGENVARSLRKGQPVVVHGRYFQREYVKDEMLRTAYELDALSVGHDLSRGTTTFVKSGRSLTPQPEVDPDGVPEDVSNEFVEDAVVVDPATGAAVEIDAETGEVRELAPF